MENFRIFPKKTQIDLKIIHSFSAYSYFFNNGVLADTINTGCAKPNSTWLRGFTPEYCLKCFGRIFATAD